VIAGVPDVLGEGRVVLMSLLSVSHLSYRESRHTLEFLAFTPISHILHISLPRFLYTLSRSLDISCRGLISQLGAGRLRGGIGILSGKFTSLLSGRSDCSG